MKKHFSILKVVVCLLFLMTISFASNAMKNGVVKFYNEAKGFGFVTDSETGLDMEFTVRPGVQFEIGENVTFIIITKGNGEVMILMEGKKGLNAVNVKKA